MTQTQQGEPQKGRQMQAEMPATDEAPLGSARNPIPPGDSRPGWTTGPSTPFVVYSEVDK